MFEGVSEALRLAGDLPESCKSMLVSMVPGTLGVVKEDRSGTQERVVEMIGEVVGRVQTNMQQDHEKELQQLSKIEGSKSQLDRNVDEAGEEVVKATEALDNMKKQLASAYSAHVSRKSEFAQAKEAQEIGDAPLAAIRAEKERCEAIVAEEFKAVREGTVHTKEQSDKLITLAGKLTGMDESL